MGLVRLEVSLEGKREASELWAVSGKAEVEEELWGHCRSDVHWSELVVEGIEVAEGIPKEDWVAEDDLCSLDGSG